jgi:CheY-like chemotaxis protein
VLVSDVVMPGMTGPELAGELVRDRPELRVLFLSGFADEQSAERGLVGPRSAFLAKPFAPDALVRVVEELLARS